MHRVAAAICGVATSRMAAIAWQTTGEHAAVPVRFAPARPGPPVMDAGAGNRVTSVDSLTADMERSTQELVGFALAGDREAMRHLFAHVICPVVERRLAHRVALAGADRAALRDHVQEVLVHLLDRNAEVLRRWDPKRGPLEPYVAKVAENHMISRLRRRPPPSPSEDLDSEPATSATPEESAAFSFLVLRLLRDITDNDAALFRAVYLEELSPDEAAARLGITREAAHKRIQRLRVTLSKMLSSPKEPRT